jgi:hypothetical protein
VRGDVTVAPHAVFNAVSMSTLNVGDDVTAGDDSIVGLGCSPEAGCSTLTNDHIGGDLRTTDAFAVVVQQEAIAGDASIVGGGRSEDCSVTVFFGGPWFSTIEDSSVGGNATITGLHTCWFGFIRVHVGGNVLIQGTRMGDPDANEIVTNVIHGNLACYNNVPAAQFGDSGGSPNVVGGKKLGECKDL